MQKTFDVKSTYSLWPGIKLKIFIDEKWVARRNFVFYFHLDVTAKVYFYHRADNI